MHSRSKTQAIPNAVAPTLSVAYCLGVASGRRASAGATSLFLRDPGSQRSLMAPCNARNECKVMNVDKCQNAIIGASNARAIVDLIASAKVSDPGVVDCDPASLVFETLIEGGAPLNTSTSSQIDNGGSSEGGLVSNASLDTTATRANLVAEPSAQPRSAGSFYSGSDSDKPPLARVGTTSANQLFPRVRSWVVQQAKRIFRPLTRRIYLRIVHFVDTSGTARATQATLAATSRIEEKLNSVRTIHQDLSSIRGGADQEAMVQVDALDRPAVLRDYAIAQQSASDDLMIQLQEIRRDVSGELVELRRRLFRIENHNSALEFVAQNAFRFLERMNDRHDALVAATDDHRDSVMQGIKVVLEEFRRFDARYEGLVTAPFENQRFLSDEIRQMLESSETRNEALYTSTGHVEEMMVPLHQKVDRIGEVVSSLLARSEASFDLMQLRLDELLCRQIIPLNGGRLLAIKCSEGFLVVPSHDFAQVIYLGQGELPESGTRSVVTRFLPIGGTLVDVGANLGLFTLTGSRKVGARGRVIAIEPTPETVDCLRQTIWINGVSDIVELHEVGAGPREGSAQLFLGATSSWNSMIASEGVASIQVPIQSVDQIVGRRLADVVKIDVEGWELQVLDGMSELIERCPQLVIILEFGLAHLERVGISPPEWLEGVQRAGLSVYSINEGDGSLNVFSFESVQSSANVLLGRGIELRAPDLFRSSPKE